MIPAVCLLLTSATGLFAEPLPRDLTLLRKALDDLHPGLTLHRTKQQDQAAWGELERFVPRGGTRQQFYLRLSRYLAGVQCGHTYANFYNQTDAVKAELFDRDDKVPFTFAILDRRIFIRESATLARGTEVLGLNGRPVGDLLAELQKYVKADGKNDGKRLSDLEVSGLGRFEAFDIFQPMLLPPREGKYSVLVQELGAQPRTVEMAAVSRDSRRIRLRLATADPWEFRMLPEGPAYLRLSSFTTWNFRFDWKAFLADACAKAKDQPDRGLIIDIRGNEGGDDSVITELLKYVIKQPTTIPKSLAYVIFQQVSDELRPHLSTWDQAVFNAAAYTRPIGDGRYEVQSESSRDRILQPSSRAFSGKVVLLVGPANSSATFTVARTWKQQGLATLVGRPTGGSRKGTNGGKFLVYKMPDAGFTVDIPLVAYRPEPSGPDAGIVPDVLTKWTVEDIRLNRDPDLVAAINLIAKSSGKRRS